MPSDMKTYAVYGDVWDVEVQQRELLVERFRTLLTRHGWLSRSTHRTDQCRGGRYDNWRNGADTDRPGGACCPGVLFVHVWIYQWQLGAPTQIWLRLGGHQSGSRHVRRQLHNERLAVARQTVARQRVDRHCVAAQVNGVTAQLTTPPNINMLYFSYCIIFILYCTLCSL